MTTKITQKMNSWEISKICYETKSPKQSVKIYNQPRKYCLSQQNYLRLLISEIGINGDKNQSRNKTVEKVFLKKKMLAWKLLKVIAIYYNVKIGCYMSWECNWELSFSGLCRITTKRKTNFCKKITKFCKRTLSQPKSATYSIKTINVFGYGSS